MTIEPRRPAPGARPRPQGSVRTPGSDRSTLEGAGSPPTATATPPLAYRPAVITFLDILGFSDQVARSDTPHQIGAILRRLAAFAADPADLEAELEDTAAIVFSDSIVRIRYIDGPYRSGALFQEVLKLLRVQGEMLADDVLLRGGLTIGTIHTEGQIAFGPGFIRAYQLESQFANYPRIVIGPEVFTALREDQRLWADHHDLEDEVHYQRQMLHQGDDGFWFIDYLFGFQDEMDHPEEHAELVAQHRGHIIASANAASVHSRVLQKYLWLARYLNNVAERLGRADLTITQADIPSLEALADEPEWARPHSGPTIGRHDFGDGDE